MTAAKVSYSISVINNNGLKVWWKWNGFTADENKAAILDSVDFADWTVQLESKEHPDWSDWAFRVVAKDDGGAKIEEAPANYGMCSVCRRYQIGQRHAHVCE